MKNVCGCDEAKRLRAQLERLQERAPVITDDPYFYEVANAIDDELGWRTEADEAGGLYADRIREVAAELKTLRAERDYMLTGLDPSEVRVMRQELAKDHDDECERETGT